MTTTAKSPTAPVVQRYRVNDTTRLSIVSWGPDEDLRYSVGLLRKQGRRWHVDHDTVRDMRGPVHVSAYAATDYAYDLIVAELGEAPPRFFRDNHITRKGGR